MKLLDAFDIPAVGIVDKDDDKEYTHPRIRKTKQRDIEAEIVTILDKGREDILLQILTAHDTKVPENHMRRVLLRK
ncbi:MAG: hypothetical protein IPN60_18675 [Saprospiraceae bacterium]|nr:hypothetical protein [Candidatus Opimibacter skivensis]